MNKWDKNFLELAKTVSTFSKDPSTQVGAVIVDDDNRVISIGYNGFPKGIKDDDRLDNRELKYEMIVHAEANALLFANAPVKGCTIYTWPFQPCSRCASLIIQSGIRRVVSVESKDQKWSSNFQLAHDMMTEARIEIKTYILSIFLSNISNSFTSFLASDLSHLNKQEQNDNI